MCTVLRVKAGTPIATASSRLMSFFWWVRDPEILAFPWTSPGRRLCRGVRSTTRELAATTDHLEPTT